MGKGRRRRIALSPAPSSSAHSKLTCPIRPMKHNTVNGQMLLRRPCSSDLLYPTPGPPILIHLTYRCRTPSERSSGNYNFLDLVAFMGILIFFKKNNLVVCVLHRPVRSSLSGWRYASLAVATRGTWSSKLAVARVHRSKRAQRTQACLASSPHTLAARVNQIA